MQIVFFSKIPAVRDFVTTYFDIPQVIEKMASTILKHIWKQQIFIQFFSLGNISNLWLRSSYENW